MPVVAFSTPEPAPKRHWKVMFKGPLKTDNLFKRLLAIGAHPDDIELGCFGTLLRFQRSGSKIALCVLSNGERGVNPTNRCAEARTAARLVQGDLTPAGLADTQIPEGQPTIRVIEEVIQEFQPTAVFVNSPNDMHQDHRNVSRAAVSAARLVPSLFLYQTPSSTRTFTPQVFVDISSVIKDKVHAITIHKSQAKHSYMANRAVKELAEFLALQIYRCGKYFEGVEVHQIVL